MRNKIAIGLISFALISSCANLLGALPKTVELDLKAVEVIGIPEWMLSFCDFLN